MNRPVTREQREEWRAEASAHRRDDALPPGTVQCDHADHPAKIHGHYGYGGRHWCSDLRSPSLSEENMGHYRGGRLILFAKRVTSPEARRS